LGTVHASIRIVNLGYTIELRDVSGSYCNDTDVLGSILVFPELRWFLLEYVRFGLCLRLEPVIEDFLGPDACLADPEGRAPKYWVFLEHLVPARFGYAEVGSSLLGAQRAGLPLPDQQIPEFGPGKPQEGRFAPWLPGSHQETRTGFIQASTASLGLIIRWSQA
jgi:hypothetical protein